MNDVIKEKIGEEAAKLVQPGMLVGIGTGSTAYFFIQSLIKRCQEGLKITAVATSERSTELLKKGNVPVLESGSFTTIDLTIDGADEIDPYKRLIKGGGGALLREKIVASSSTEMVVIATTSKLVQNLGAFGLPVEIIPFGFRATLSKLYKLGYQGTLRKTQAGEIYKTDNGNFILDIHFQPTCENPEKDHETIRNIAGVVETGFFIHIAGRIMLGFDDGHVEVFSQLPHTLSFKA